MANYLTQNDLDNYGPELLDVTQRAALNAVSPYIQQLQRQNADLQARQVQEQRRRLDQQVATLVPDYQDIDRNPAWHQWLRGVDLMSGRIRQALLNEAIRNGDARRVELFFKQFQQQAGQSSSSSRASGGRPAPSNKPVYTRDQIKQLHAQHLRGAYAGREAEWARQEEDIIAASREGRILGGVDVFGK
jgi:hypothetical protein